jgi:hypothetical protein
MSELVAELVNEEPCAQNIVIHDHVQEQLGLPK